MDTTISNPTTSHSLDTELGRTPHGGPIEAQIEVDAGEDSGKEKERIGEQKSNHKMLPPEVLETY